MNISNQIDSLIKNLSALKPYLVNDPGELQAKFKNILEEALSSSGEKAQPSQPISNMSEGIPNWIDKNYVFAEGITRKPNMREMMQALSGQDIEELYKLPKSEWQKYSNHASELLYGVVGSKTDTRDWEKIMGAKNILVEAQRETQKLHEAKIEVESEYDEQENLINQYAVIKDKSGTVLRALTGNIDSVTKDLNNFGVGKASVPIDINERVNLAFFDNKILHLLQNHDLADQSLQVPKPSNEIEKLALNATTDAIAMHLERNIPIEELEKL